MGLWWGHSEDSRLSLPWRLALLVPYTLHFVYLCVTGTPSYVLYGDDGRDEQEESHV